MTSRTSVVSLLIVLAATGCDEPFQEEHARFASITQGMSEAEVHQRLGKPFRTHSAEDPSATDYYVDGYAREERPITAKVLIYMGSDSVAYVYIDKNDKVEHVFVGGS